VKHRSTATELVEGGHVRLNRVKVSKPGHALREGDVLTLALHGEIRVVKVLGAAEKRGPAAEARLLYEDLAVQQIPSSQAENLGA
jgi:ribosome-associated heat shock protein Hsp15